MVAAFLEVLLTKQGQAQFREGGDRTFLAFAATEAASRGTSILNQRPGQPTPPASNAIRMFQPARDHHPDFDLVREVLEGRSDATERFLSRMHALPSIAYSLNSRNGSILNDSELEDVVQNCLSSLWSQLAKYEGRGPLDAWVLGICRNKLRVAARQKSNVDRQVVEPLLGALEAYPDVQADQQVDFDESELLHQAMARLPAGRARLIRMKHYESMTLQQIASQLELSLGSVKADYFRGLKQLRAMLARSFGEAGPPTQGITT